MEYRNRFISNKLMRYLQYFPVIVLTGARQVGKSTLLEQLLGESHRIIVFDPVIDVANARSDPELFFKNNPGPLILDEIQYAPELVPVIKRLVDKDRIPGKYVLTGSQQWGVLDTISESLAGRAILLNLMGFNIPEIADSDISPRWLEKYLKGSSKEAQVHYSLPYTLPEQLYRGQLPEAQDLPLDIVSGFLNSCIRTYIERDVRMMAEVSDLQLFGKFFRLCGALSAQEVNYTHLGRDIGMTPQTAKRWLAILRATFQWIEIPAYSGNTVKRVSGKPKGYLSDTGLHCNALYLSGPEAIPSHPQWGSIVETFIVLDILKTLSHLGTEAGVYHWRSHGGAELDLILEQDGIFFPIEIKSTTRPSKRDALGIKAFRETYPKLRIGEGVVIHLGEENFRLAKGVLAISYTCI